jgi:aminopeptidase
MNRDILKKYSDVILTCGVNIQPGQVVVIETPLEARDLALAISRLAYEKGSSYVIINYEDAELRKIRAEDCKEEFLLYYPTWQYDYLKNYVQQDVCDIKILSSSVDFKENNNDRLLKMNRSQEMLNHGKRQVLGLLQTNWVWIPYPNETWAGLVYPGLEPQAALGRLWQDLIKILKLDAEDPVAAWRQTQDDIRLRRKKLNELHINKILFSGNGTELEIGIHPSEPWGGGEIINLKNGLVLLPQIPTWEIFNIPEKYGVNGVVRTTRPRFYGDILMDDIVLEFEKGKIVNYHASKGYEMLRSIIETDEGSHFLGEIALVSTENPIYEAGRIFYNAGIDENAVSHMAIGDAKPTTLANTQASREEKELRGINTSKLHVDLMIGSENLNVYAITDRQEKKLILENGRWAI